MYLFELQFCPDVCPGVGLLDHMVVLFLFGLFFFFRAISMAYGSSQAMGPIRAVAAGLRHSLSNTRSKVCLQPTPQLTAMPGL